ncbi:MAG: hypothetical protein GXX79_12215 [Actinomycetales bacterium]|nr:hypothetical protein [Actinomycetales bacterium]
MSVELVGREAEYAGHLLLAWPGSSLGLGVVQREVLGAMADMVESLLSSDAGMARCGTVRRLDVPAGPWSSVSAISLAGNPSRGQVWEALEDAFGACAGRVFVSAAAMPPLALDLVEAVVGAAVVSTSSTGTGGEVPGAISFRVLVADTERAAGVEQGARLVARALGRARAWTDAPGNRLGPSEFVEELCEQGRVAGLEVTRLDGAELAARGYGGITAVAGGSSQPGWLVRLDHRPPDVNARAPVALVGKGVTFDSGGLSLKTGSVMASMRRDMAGAAAVGAVMLALPTLRVQAAVRAYIPVVENMPGGSAYRPGDVVTLYGGRSVEIDTTDAEGRLILAEAMVTAFEDGAQEVIEVSTLCGAGVLGRHLSGVMGEDALVGHLLAAAHEAGEGLWRMPLPVQVREGLRSTAADLHQVVPGGEWDSPMIQGGAFLSHFVPEGRAWAHIDLGGQVTRTSTSGTVASGVPVRTLLRFLTGRASRNDHAG